MMNDLTCPDGAGYLRVASFQKGLGSEAKGLGFKAAALNLSLDEKIL